MTWKSVRQNMEYCALGLSGKKKKEKAGNVSGTQENEQTTGTKSYVGCMYFLITQPQEKIAFKQRGIVARPEVFIIIPPLIGE